MLQSLEGNSTKRLSTFRRTTVLLCIAALLCAALIAVPTATLPQPTTVIRPLSLVSSFVEDDTSWPLRIGTPLPLLRGPPA